MKLQCGYEDTCKVSDCLKCKRYLKLKSLIITLAEADCIESFGVNDLNLWERERRNLAQDVMRKLNQRIKW